ncbi:MAG: complex I subunit 4 family protein [Planctomycetaceae bacterium]
MNVLLPAMILLPLGAAVLLVLLRSSEGAVARWGALLASAVTLLLSLAIAAQFDATAQSTADGPVAPRFEVRQPWLTFGQADGSEVRLEFFLGLDGISLLLVLLTTLLTACCVLVSWDSVKERATEFYACLLVLETGLLGAFCAFDLLLFYVFFEFTLIPLFFLIGIWGGPDRRRAAGRFFIYTLTGSLATLVGLVALALAVINRYGLETPFAIPEIARALAADPLPYSWQVGIFLALAAGFVIKVPLFPFHTWLPLAHVEAPTAGSVLLAGVLLKLGTYGFLRLCLPLLPAACLRVGVPLIAVLSIIGIIYGALCALAQSDIKKLVAYSSVSHLGFCMLGLFALNVEGISGGVLQMINHGLSTGALFLLVGMLYERYHTRQLTDLGGLAAKLPLLAIAMVFISLSSMGLPGLNGFVGEFLSLVGMFKAHPLYAAVGATGVVLGAWYLLTMLQRAFFGPLREPDLHGETVRDVGVREFVMLVPVMALCLWIGVAPQPLLNTIRPDVERIVRLYEDDAPERVETAERRLRLSELFEERHR